MSPSSVETRAPIAVARSLTAKIECAILSALVHCHGDFEGSLETWFRALKLAFPEIDRVAEVRDVFKQLCEAGIVGLNSPWIGEFDASCGDEDFHFLALDTFKTSLTSLGVVRWDAIRR